MSKGGGAIEAGVLPDIHHLMSKKIAQLTKVIYHLNSKSEDHGAELKALSEAYEAEIDAILKDAHRKIADFKAALDAKRAENKIKQATDALMAQHESERKAALAEFEAFKNRVKDKEKDIERRLAAEFEARTAAMTQQFEEAKEQFAARIKNFNELAKRFESEKGGASKDIDRMMREMKELKEKHQAELTDHVQRSNGKYNSLVEEKFKLEEQLRAQIEAEKTKTEGERNRAETERVRAEKLAATVANLEKEVANKDRDLNALRAEMAAMQRAHDNEMNALRSGGEAKAAEALQNLRESSERRIAELNEKLAQRERDWAQEKARLEATHAQNVHVLEDKARELQSKLDASERNLAATAASFRDAEARIHALTDSLARAEEKARELERQLSDKDRARGTLSEEIEAMKRQHQKESDKLRAEWESKYNKLLQETSAAAARAADELTKAKETIAQLQETVKALRNNERDLASRASNLDKDMVSREAEFQRALREAKDKGDAALRDAQSAAEARLKKAIDDANAAHRLELEKRDAEHRTQLEMLRSTMEAEKRDALDAVRGQLNGSQLSAERERAELMEKLNALKQENEGLLENLKQLRLKLSDLESSSSAQRGESSALISGLETRVRGLQTELDELRQKKEALEQQLVHDAQEAERRLRLALEQLERELNDEWTKKANMEGSSLAQRHAQEQREREQRAEAERQRLENEYKQKLDAAARALERAQEDARNQLRAKDQEIERLKASFEAERTRLRGELSNSSDSMRSNYERELAAANSAHAAEKERLQRQTAAELERAAANLAQAQRDAEARLAAALQQLTAELTEKHRRELAAENEAHRLLMDRELAELEKRLRNELGSNQERAMETILQRMRDEKNQLVDEHRAALAALAASHSKEITALEQRVSEAQRIADKANAELQAVRHDLQSARKEVSDSQREVARLKEDLLEQARRAQRELLEQRERLLQERKEEIDRLTDDNLRETNALNEEFHRAQLLMEERCAMLEKRITDLQFRLDSRESRPEDIEKIKQLSAELKEAKALVKKTIEEMQYFKLELLNREENFNKVFNANPNIGVLDPRAKKGSGGSGGAPHYASTGQAMAQVLGLQGGGMGVGGMGVGGMGGGGGIVGRGQKPSGGAFASGGGGGAPASVGFSAAGVGVTSVGGKRESIRDLAHKRGGPKVGSSDTSPDNEYAD